MPINLQCTYCYCKIEKRPRDVKRYSNHFCGNECHHKWRKEISGAIIECTTCGATLRRTFSAIRKSKSGNFFCNASCAAKFNNTGRSREMSVNWKGGYSSYRERALKHYGKACSNPNCEITANNIFLSDKMLDVHHVDGDRKSNGLENLQVLCVWCHAKKTRKISTTLVP
jgi:hypothetical protein